MVFYEQFKEMLKEGLKDIEIILFHHAKEMFFLHLTYLLSLPI